MRYKVGDRVVIDDKNKDKLIDDCLKYCGKIAMITEVHKYGRRYAYKLDIDGGDWIWSERRLNKELSEKLNHKNKTKYQEDTETLNCIAVAKEIYSDKYTIVILLDGRKGIAKCHPDDEFNKQRGFEVALAKALLKEVKR